MNLDMLDAPTVDSTNCFTLSTLLIDTFGQIRGITNNAFVRIKKLAWV